MQIEVGFARRPGIASLIHDQPLKKDVLQVGLAGNVTLTIEASGMIGERSHYRYRISLTAAEAARLASAIAGTTVVQAGGGDKASIVGLRLGPMNHQDVGFSGRFDKS